jgi:hypothetical protein
MSATFLFLSLLVAGDPISSGDSPPAAATATSPAPATTAVAAAPAPAPARVRDPLAPTPFRLGLTYTHVLIEDGSLTNGQLATNAIGIDLGFPSSSYVRNHLGLANQWEHAGSYSARGFRIDLISFGYPITLVNSAVRLDLEPILTLVRGEIMFVNAGPNLFRMESGFGLDLSATYRHWFLGVEPAVDFRYWVYSKADSQTGFGRIFPFRAALGHEF